MELIYGTLNKLSLYNVSVPSAYPAGFAGLDFTAYGARGTIFDYGLEPSILGEFNFNLAFFNTLESFTLICLFPCLKPILHSIYRLFTDVSLSLKCFAVLTGDNL